MAARKPKSKGEASDKLQRARELMRERSYPHDAELEALLDDLQGDLDKKK